MATIDELIAQGNLVRPGGFLGPGNSNIQDGRVRGQGNAGTQRTGTTTVTRTPAAPQRTLTPVGTSPADRVNRALAIRQSMGGIQGSREAAETTANAGLAESLRLSLIEQERLRKNMQIPGTVSPIKYRAMLAERAANQKAINSGIEAINAMRTGQVTTRGQDLAAETTLADRRMAESGAFDRRLLGLDETMLRGQFGLQEQAMRNEGAVAAQQALNPLEQNALRLMTAAEEQVAETGTTEDQARLGFSLINASLGTAALTDPTAGEPNVEFTYIDEQGFEQTGVLPQSELIARTRVQEYMNNPGMVMSEAETERGAQLVASGIPPAQANLVILQERAQNQQQQQRRAQANAERGRQNLLQNPPLTSGGL